MEKYLIPFQITDWSTIPSTFKFWILSQLMILQCFDIRVLCLLSYY